MRKGLIIILTLFSFVSSANDLSKINGLKKDAEKAFKNKNYEKAIGQYAQLLDSMNVEDDAARLNMAHALFESEDLEGAKSNYLKLALSKNNQIKSIAYQQLGNLSSQPETLKNAVSFYKEAIKADPTNDGARYNYELAKKALENQEDQNQENQDNQDQENQDQDQQNEDQKEGENQNQEDQQGDQQNQDQQGDQEQDSDSQEQNQENQQGEQNNQNQEGQEQEGQQNEQEQDGQEQQQGQNEQEQEGQEGQQSQQGEEQEGEESQQEQQSQGKEDGEEQEEQQGATGQPGQENEEGEEGKSGLSPDESTIQKLLEMNMTEETARMLLEAQENQEVQYIQQNRRRPTQKRDKSKPDW